MAAYQTMDGALCSQSGFMVLTLRPAKKFVQKKWRRELGRAHLDTRAEFSPSPPPRRRGAG